MPGSKDNNRKEYIPAILLRQGMREFSIVSQLASLLQPIIPVLWVGEFGNYSLHRPHFRLQRFRPSSRSTP